MSLKGNLTTSFSRGRCGLVVGIGCCGGNHITLAVHSIFTGSILGFHMSEGAKEKPRIHLHTFYTKTKLAENHTNTKKKHPTSNFSLCRSCLVVWIWCWGGSHSIFTCSILGFHMSEGAREKPRDTLTHLIQKPNLQKTTQKLKRNSLPVTSACAEVVWLSGLGAGVVATASSLAPP